MASPTGKTVASSRKSSEGKQLKVGPDICTACDTGDLAESHCQECPDYLCTECTKSHKRQNRTKQHTLEDVIHTVSTIATYYQGCPQHRDIFITKFCLTCSEIACENCIKESHKNHSVNDIVECEEQVFSLCLDKSKQLQRPFHKMKKAKKSMEGNRKLFIDNCDSVEDQIIKRKAKLIDMITVTAEQEIRALNSTKQQVGSLYTQTLDHLDRSLKECEGTGTPMAMGTNMNDMIKRVLCITREIEEAGTLLSTVDVLEKNSNIKLNVGVFPDIQSKTNEYICFQKSDLSEVSQVVLSLGKSKLARSGSIIETETTKQPTKYVEEAIRQTTETDEMPNKVKFVNKITVESYLYVSKHFTASNTVAQFRTDGPVELLTYNDETTKIDRKLSFEPKPLEKFGCTLLTISSSKHIIISKEAIHLGNNNKIIRSEPHTTDGYVPDIIGYVDQNKFVTLSSKQNQIRYHDAKSLAVLHSFHLDSIYIHSSSILCTSEKTLLLETSKDVLTEFTAEGKEIRKVPIHGDYFECHTYTRCIDENNILFGVRERDGSIHAFSIQGGHTVLDSIDLEYIWSAGIDKEEQAIYVCYSKDVESFIAKYKY